MVAALIVVIHSLCIQFLLVSHVYVSIRIDVSGGGTVRHEDGLDERVLPGNIIASFLQSLHKGNLT